MPSSSSSSSTTEVAQTPRGDDDDGTEEPSSSSTDNDDESDEDNDVRDQKGTVDEDDGGSTISIADDNNEDDDGSESSMQGPSSLPSTKAVAATTTASPSSSDSSNSNRRIKSRATEERSRHRTTKTPKKDDQQSQQPPPLQPTKPNDTSPTATTAKSLEDQELIRLALHRNPYFTCLDEEQIENFIRHVRLERFRPGQAVLLEASSGGSNSNSSSSTGSQRRHQPPRRNQRIGWNTTADADDSGPADVEDDNDGEILVDDVTTPPSITRPPSSSLPLSIATTTPSQQEDEGTTSSSLYLIRRGNADVFYQSLNPASLGPATVFGEGGFLFGRHHSASVVAASDPFECWVMDHDVFWNYVLPSQNMKQLFRRYARRDRRYEEDPKNDDSEYDDDGDDNDDNDNDENMDDYYMTMEDFILSLQQHTNSSSGETAVAAATAAAAKASTAMTYENILRTASFSALDAQGGRDGRRAIRLGDFCLFHLLMARPDPEVDIAFMLMDRSKSGVIGRDDFEAYLENLVYFDPNAEFVDRYFGHGQTVRAYQFPQFLADLQQEMGRQAFLFRAQQLDQHAGYLPPDEFIDVLKRTCGWRLPDGVVDRLESLYCKQSIDSAEATALASVRAGAMKGDSPKQVAEYSRRAIQADLERRRNRLGTRYFSYVDFVAFQDVLVELPGIYHLIERACQIKDGPISPDDLKVVNRVWGMNLSRSQVDLIFQMFDLDQDGYISPEDATSVCGLDIGGSNLKAVEGRDGKSTFAPPPNYPKTTSIDGITAGGTFLGDNPTATKERIFNQVIQFSLSALAGGIAMAVVYPLDLVKTRMMNQRIAVDGVRLYSNAFECFQKVVQVEGMGGLYRGLLPPLLAVGPEKFIKFTVNDLLRGVASKDGGSSSLIMDIASGGCAGACQLLVSNPLEITKIRMQMQGETARMFREKGFSVPKGLGLNYMSFSEVSADLGISGLYRGAAACLMRDVPFGAIYFPAYAASLDYFKGNSSHATASDILLSGTLAGIPAAFLTTPMDFIKTRLQVVPRPGETAYDGTSDCIRKVYQAEGPSAFFKGAIPRICRIAPQFGISLLCYEKLSTFLGFKGAAPPTNAPVNPHDYKAAFSTGIEIDSKANDIEALVRSMSFSQQETPPKRPPSF